MLVVASMLFCALEGPVSLAFLALSIVGNFAAMGVIRRMAEGSAARKLVVVGAVLANLAPLLAFKAAQQGIGDLVGHPPGTTPTVLPLGLAFYTLQQITFLIDGQRTDGPRLGFVRFAAWGSFFGQLPAGPIGAWSRMAPQFGRLGFEPLQPGGLARGLTLVLFGITKKVWLADPMARKVDAVFLGIDVGGVTPLEAWTAAWGYMLQLYFDFSAYSDIAIGVGLCFGLILPINFNSPLKAATPGQYVLRWHISLMTFVRDYVFEPLFRVARKLPIRPTSRRYGIAWALSTLAAFLAVAAWHTVAPLPLLQGLLVAFLIIVIQFIRQTSRGAPRQAGPIERRMVRVAGQVLLLLGASVIALFLRAHGDGQLALLLPALVDVDAVAHFRGELYPNARLPGVRTLLMMAAATGIVLLCPNTMQIFGIAGAAPPPRALQWRPTALWGWLTVGILVLALIGMTRPVHQYGFIYAQF